MSVQPINRSSPTRRPNKPPPPPPSIPTSTSSSVLNIHNNGSSLVNSSIATTTKMSGPSITMTSSNGSWEQHAARSAAAATADDESHHWNEFSVIVMTVKGHQLTSSATTVDIEHRDPVEHGSEVRDVQTGTVYRRKPNGVYFRLTSVDSAENQLKVGDEILAVSGYQLADMSLETARILLSDQGHDSKVTVAVARQIAKNDVRSSLGDEHMMTSYDSNNEKSPSSDEVSVDASVDDEELVGSKRFDYHDSSNDDVIDGYSEEEQQVSLVDTTEKQPQKFTNNKTVIHIDSNGNFELGKANLDARKQSISKSIVDADEGQADGIRLTIDKRNGSHTNALETCQQITSQANHLLSNQRADRYQGDNYNQDSPSLPVCAPPTYVTSSARPQTLSLRPGVHADELSVSPMVVLSPPSPYASDPPQASTPPLPSSPPPVPPISSSTEHHPGQTNTASEFVASYVSVIGVRGYNSRRQGASALGLRQPHPSNVDDLVSNECAEQDDVIEHQEKVGKDNMKHTSSKENPELSSEEVFSAKHLTSRKTGFVTLEDTGEPQRLEESYESTEFIGTTTTEIVVLPVPNGFDEVTDGVNLHAADDSWKCVESDTLDSHDDRAVFSSTISQRVAEINVAEYSAVSLSSSTSVPPYKTRSRVMSDQAVCDVIRDYYLPTDKVDDYDTTAMDKVDDITKKANPKPLISHALIPKSIRNTSQTVNVTTSGVDYAVPTFLLKGNSVDKVEQVTEKTIVKDPSLGSTDISTNQSLKQEFDAATPTIASLKSVVDVGSSVAGEREVLEKGISLDHNTNGQLSSEEKPSSSFKPSESEKSSSQKKHEVPCRSEPSFRSQDKPDSSSKPSDSENSSSQKKPEVPSRSESSSRSQNKPDSSLKPSESEKSSSQKKPEFPINSEPSSSSPEKPGTTGSLESDEERMEVAKSRAFFASIEKAFPPNPMLTPVVRRNSTKSTPNPTADSFITNVQSRTTLQSQNESQQIFQAPSNVQPLSNVVQSASKVEFACIVQPASRFVPSASNVKQSASNAKHYASKVQPAFNVHQRAFNVVQLASNVKAMETDDAKQTLSSDAQDELPRLADARALFESLNKTKSTPAPAALSTSGDPARAGPFVRRAESTVQKESPPVRPQVTSTTVVKESPPVRQQVASVSSSTTTSATAMTSTDEQKQSLAEASSLANSKAFSSLCGRSKIRLLRSSPRPRRRLSRSRCRCKQCRQLSDTRSRPRIRRF